MCASDIHKWEGHPKGNSIRILSPHGIENLAMCTCDIHKWEGHPKGNSIEFY
jgi:hypothetical protein